MAKDEQYYSSHFICSCLNHHTLFITFMIFTYGIPVACGVGCLVLDELVVKKIVYSSSGLILNAMVLYQSISLHSDAHTHLCFCRLREILQKQKSTVGGQFWLIQLMATFFHFMLSLYAKHRKILPELNPTFIKL